MFTAHETYTGFKLGLWLTCYTILISSMRFCLSFKVFTLNVFSVFTVGSIYQPTGYRNTYIYFQLIEISIIYLHQTCYIIFIGFMSVHNVSPHFENG